MEEAEQRALYTLLRMNWLNDPTLEVESWQVADYRNESLEELFERLEQEGLSLDRTSLLAYINSVDTPEALAEEFVEEGVCNSGEEDRIYLVLFELWRRLAPEKRPLSIFCDEMDHQIFLYDQGDASADEFLQEALSSLEIFLEENLDAGVNPQALFQTVQAYFANDLETFLYDYIIDQVDAEQIEYAQALLETFSPYLPKSPWLELLKVRVTSGEKERQNLLKKVIAQAIKGNDLDLGFEVLSTLIQLGEKRDFNRMVRHLALLIHEKGDVVDLLEICLDYYSCIDEDGKAQAVKKILETQNPQVEELLKIL